MSRIVILAGHYGSGKTNVALNWARWLRRVTAERVAIADLDIVNPYFRTKDSAAALREDGIELVVSEYANSNVDFPAMPKEIYGLVADRTCRVVMDVGGDDRGALALGRYVDDIRAENSYEMLAVVNFSRPLTRTPEAALAVLREIESAAALPFTGLVNNTNLGPETTADTVRDSLAAADRLAALAGLPIRLTSVAARLFHQLDGSIPDLLPLDVTNPVRDVS